MKKILFFKNIKIKYLFLLTILLVNIISTTIYSIDTYITGKERILQATYDKLLTAAYGAKFFADPLHDMIKDKNPFSREEYLKIMDNLTKFARKINVEFVYTMVVHKGKIVFTSENPPPITRKKIRKNYKLRFFTEYKDASLGLIKATIDKQIHYDEYRDLWGYHRSIFLPTVSPSGKEYIIGVDIKMDYLKKTLNSFLFKTILIGVGIFTISSVFIIFIVILLVNPLKSLTNSAEIIGTGNLEVEIPDVKIGYEITKLTETMTLMQRALKTYIEMLKKTVADNERIESELRIAHNIQMNILPKVFPTRKEFDIYAFIKPAREVGGDFYDFFFIDQDHLGFVIADVSDKGIPSALFMAVAKTLIKSKTIPERQPGEILFKVNNELCQNNESSMFVTVFLGILNIKTGNILYSNAGHNPPLIIKNNSIEFLKVSTNFVLGGIENTEYTTESLKLEHGNIIFLYTDGVTEALNEQGEFFSDKRLKQELINNINYSLKDMILNIKQKIELFSINTKQTDDITMLAIKFIERE